MEHEILGGLQGRIYIKPAGEEYKQYLSRGEKDPDMMLYYREQIAHEREMEKLIQMKDIVMCACKILGLVDQ